MMHALLRAVAALGLLATSSAYADDKADARCNAVYAALAQACVPFSKDEEATNPAAPATSPNPIPAAPAATAAITLTAAAAQEICGNFPSTAVGPELGCDELATVLEYYIETGTDKRAKAPSEAEASLSAAAQVEAQPDRRTATNKSGAAGQIEAVEPMRPINLAGGALSLAGTRSGAQAVATVTINPLALANPTSEVSQRTMDISVTAPFNLKAEDGNVSRFVGIRLRSNMVAWWSTKPLKAALSKLYDEAGAYADSLELLLSRTEDVEGCVKAILKKRETPKSECGGEISSAQLKELMAASYDAIDDARREADKHYLGIDARADIGDPTDKSILGDKGTRIVGGLAFGTRVACGENWDFEFRGRGAADYFDGSDRLADGSKPATVFSADWGAAAVLLGRVTKDTDKQRIAFGVGLEGKHAKHSEAANAAPTNYVDLNLMTIVPTTSGNDVGLRIRIPLNDSKVPRGTLLSFSTDLGLLDGSSPSKSKGN
jgi:hypothetical protein